MSKAIKYFIVILVVASGSLFGHQEDDGCMAHQLVSNILNDAKSHLNELRALHGPESLLLENQFCPLCGGKNNDHSEIALIYGEDNFQGTEFVVAPAIPIAIGGSVAVEIAAAFGMSGFASVAHPPCREAIQRALSDVIEGVGDIIIPPKKPKKCPPCIPPVGTIGYQLHKVPPSKPHYPIKGDHVHLWRRNQAPWPDCGCFWNKLKHPTVPPPPKGAVPIPKTR